MSCIVAISDGKRVHMACESAATSTDGDRRLIVPNKIIKNGNYLIGFSGSIRVKQLLGPRFFTPPKNILDFPNSLVAHLEDKKALSFTEEQTIMFLCNIIIAQKHKMYEILSDFQLNEPVVDYVTVGAGAHYAFGSLATTLELGGINIKERLVLALNAACLYSSDCKGPYQFYNT